MSNDMPGSKPPSGPPKAIGDAEAYPEHAKMAKVKVESQAIGEFMDTGGFTLAEHACAHEDITYEHDPIYRRSRSDNLCPDPTALDDCSHIVDMRFEHPEDCPHPTLLPVSKPINATLAHYFGIDLAAVEAEKRAMLEEIRSSMDKVSERETKDSDG